MKNLIKKILREETSKLTDEQVKAGYDVMNIITKDYQWYVSSYTPENEIVLINPKKKECIIRFNTKSNILYFFHKLFNPFFSRYIGMEEEEFRLFIKIWVEDVLKKEVSLITDYSYSVSDMIDYVIKRGKQIK